jgi:hypothetical protein
VILNSIGDKMLMACSVKYKVDFLPGEFDEYFLQSVHEDGARTSSVEY